jgi:hypothetical protein
MSGLPAERRFLIVVGCRTVSPVLAVVAARSPDAEATVVELAGSRCSAAGFGLPGADAQVGVELPGLALAAGGLLVGELA